MLDTNLCIRVLRDRPVGLKSCFNDEAEGLAISTYPSVDGHLFGVRLT